MANKLSRKELRDLAKSRDIVEVAQSMGMELFRSGKDFRWKDHDSLVISPNNGLWNWYSQHKGGDVISLVETIKEINFNQAIDYITTGNYSQQSVKPVEHEEFNYYLENYEQPLNEGRKYLKDRGLSDETIDFFSQQGLLTQANILNRDEVEPGLVFKSYNADGELVGANLQGVRENRTKYPKHGYLKQVMKNSDGLTGLHVDIGRPNRLVFAESPIDLMSYYELHKDSLQDVRLVSMDGLKDGIIGRHLSELTAEQAGRFISWSPEELAKGLELAKANGYFSDGKHADMITLAVDNDQGGRKFIQDLVDEGIPVVSDIPPIKDGQEKMDWNDFLKQEKDQPALDNSRLAQARRKLERLEGEQSQAIQKVFDHYKQTNGQPMNDKRGGDAFFRKADRLDERVVAKNQEIEQQRERVERLEERARNKELGLNRQGTGLEMSVRNIPRIREEIEKSKKGESVYTKATIKRYEKELERLEAIASRNDQVTLSPTAQALVEAGELNQWQKQPTTYFVKGLRKVALEMDETGNLVPSQKYRPKTDKERERVEELLQQLKRPEKGADMSEPEEKQGVLFENLNDITTRDKTEEKTIDSLNKENLVTSLELMQKYSVAEVGLNRPYYMGDDHRFEEATIELSHINTSSLNDFVQRYIVPKNEWEDVLEAYENLSYETLSNELVDQGVLNADQLPQEKPWQPKIITEPITSYEVVEDNNHKEQFSSAEELIDYVKKIISSDQLQKWEHILSEPGRGDVLDSLMIIDSDTADIDYGISLNGESLLELFPDRINKEVTEVTKTVTRTKEELLENNQVLSQAAPKNLEKTSSPPDLQVIFRSSDENLISEKYSSGDIIPYDTFIRALYTENNSRLEAMPAEDIPVFPPLHITNEGGTWFDLRDENGQPLVENIRYDIGGENQTISERLEKVLPSDYLEIARQKDATYPKPVLPKAVGRDSGIPVDLYTGHQNFGTVDFNDLLDSSDLGSHADKLGYGWAVAPRETFAVINNETLSQTQVDKIIDRMFATGADGNDLKQYLQNSDFSLSNYAKTGSVGSQSQEKPLDNNQETSNSNDSDLMAHKKNETIIGDFSEQAQKAAPLPEAIESQPLKDSSLSQSESHSLLQFTIENPEKSRYKAGYHPINQRDLTKLNNYAENIQNSAQWYLNNLADSTIHYFYQRDGKQYNISIGFEERHFMHFTGLFPLKDGQTAEKTLHDFAEGRGNYDNLLIANRDAAFQKVKVLPDLKAVLETDSFYFDQVSDIPKLHSLNMEKAIKSDDRDVLLAFSSNGENVYPASLMELTKQLNLQSNQSDYQNVILGIYRERDGQLEQVAINEDYIKDGGQEMFNTLKAMNLSNQEDVDYNLVEPPQEPSEPRPKSLAQRAEEIMEEDRLKAERQAQASPAEKAFDPTQASAEELSAHALDQIRKYSTDPKAMKEYLDFMSHFPGMSPRNAALVQEQWPGAQAVATYNQWQDKGKALGIKPDDIYQSTRTFTNKKTGKTKTVHYDQLSVKAGEKSKITLLRPVMVKMIPVMDATGKPVKTEQGRTKYKPQSEASPAEKAKIKSKELPVKEFMSGKFTTYKVFELSQTTLKPESYPKAMPNRQFDFDMDKVQTDKVLKGLCDYGNKIGVEMSFDKTHKLGNAKGAYFPKAQTILINPNNTPGEQVATSIHELAHATLHNPKFMSKGDVKLDTSHKELEAEMTAYIVSKHFGLDTSEESISYMASWTDNLNKMSDKELDYSMKRVHKAANQVVKCIENRTNPLPSRTRDRGISPSPKSPVPKPLNP